MRLFVALAVPDEVAAAVDAVVAPVRARYPGLRWQPHDRWHLTLAFLGQVPTPPDELVAILRPATARAPARVALSLGTAGRFGARVLWIGVNDDPVGAVAATGHELQRALTAAGMPVDEKDVRPHLTLARSRGRTRVTPDVVREIAEVDASWTVDAVELLSSVPTGHRQPNRYEPVATVPLGG